MTGQQRVIASQPARPEVAGQMAGSAKQSSQDDEGCFVAALLAKNGGDQCKDAVRVG